MTKNWDELRARLANALHAHLLEDGRCTACGDRATYQSLHQAEVLMSIPGVRGSYRVGPLPSARTRTRNRLHGIRSMRRMSELLDVSANYQ